MIFCDEAQDFTHLELMYIYSLSSFSRVRVEGYEIKQVPFAFAGDPFQTLNPTGFRWEATKARFVETVVRALDPEERSGIEDMNYRELTHNYRCSPAITGICNSIQALRAALFGIRDVRPQRTWQVEGESGLAAYYDVAERDVREQLRREKDIMVIVPCEAGEEEEYVANDEVLRELAGGENGRMAGVALSAARVKGLEANRVVVYGFGRACPELMKKCMKQGAEEEEYDALLPVQYYLNKVYVAVSRARKRLFVVDTEEGLENLWNVVTDEQEQKKLIKRLGRDGERWEGQLGQLQPGLKEYWSEDRENPEDIARRYEEQGRLEEDSYLLRAAARRYEDCRKGKRAGLCRALALWHEGHYEEAGDEYARWEEGNEALRAYWRAGAYEKIREIGQRFGSVRRTLEYELAEMMGEKKVGKRGGELLQQIAERSERESEMERFGEEAAWGRCVEEIVRRLVREREELERGPWWAKVSRYGQRLRQCGLPVSRVEIGLFKFMGNLVEEAYELWKEEEEVVRQRYGRELSLVRAEVLKYPEVLPDWEYLQKWDEIIEEYERDPKGLTERQLVSVGRAYEERKAYEQAIAVMSDAGAAEEALRLFVGSVGRGDEVAFAAGIGAMRALVAKQEWATASDMLTKEKLPEKYRDVTGKTGEYIRQHRMVLLGVFVRELAGSRVSATMRPEDQDRVTNTLVTYLLSEEMKRRGVVAMEEAGAALELVARLLDSLKFYELVMTRSATDGERWHAQRRWCKCKLEYAILLRQRGNTEEAERQERLALERAREWGVGAIEAIEERVSIEKLDHAKLVEEMRRRVAQVARGAAGEAAQRKREERVWAWDKAGRDGGVKIAVEGDVYKWQVGELKYEYAVKQRRVNITHQRTYEQSAVKLATRECVSGDVTWEKVEKNEGVMGCKAWHVRCDFRKSETEGIVEIMHLKQGVTINIRV